MVRVGVGSPVLLLSPAYQVSPQCLLGSPQGKMGSLLVSTLHLMKASSDKKNESFSFLHAFSKGFVSPN